MLLTPALMAEDPAAGGVATLTHDSWTTATNSSTITVPSGATAGDVAILFDTTASNSADPDSGGSAPTGWNLFASLLHDASPTLWLRTTISYKILVSGDLGATVTGMGIDYGTCKALAVIAPDIAATSISPSSANTEDTSGDPAAQTILSGSGTAPLIAFGVHGSRAGGGVGAATMSPVEDQEQDLSDLTTDFVYQRATYKMYNSSPANVTWDADDSGRNTVISGYLEVT